VRGVQSRHTQGKVAETQDEYPASFEMLQA
jgi:hypothetical protein